jgi:hypothetical protein
MIDFLGIGAQKAGTTWLFRQMFMHRQLWLPAQKELHYWDLNPDGDGAAWLSIFAAAPPDRIKGEFTPAYATLDSSVVVRIAAIAPALKLVYVLRNPAERAWSQARMAAWNRGLDLDDEAAVRAFLTSAGCAARNRYSRTIATWRAAFGNDALAVYLLEDMAESPQALLNHLAGHLGVDPAGFPQSDAELGIRFNVGIELPIPDYARELLYRDLREDIRMTADLIGRPLDHWLM